MALRIPENFTESLFIPRSEWNLVKPFPQKIHYPYWRVGQIRPYRMVRKKRIDQIVRSVVDLYAVTIGKDFNRKEITCITVPLCYKRGDLHIRFGFIGIVLTSIGCCCIFWNSEHIHDTVIADFVAGTEVLVSVIVKCTPAYGSADCRICELMVDHSGMAKGMFPNPVFRIKPFCRIHMSVILGN